MRRKTSERNKAKGTPEKSPEKSTRKSHRHSRRRRKSSSSSSEDEKPLKKSSSETKTTDPKVSGQKIELVTSVPEVVKIDLENDVSAGSSKKSNKKSNDSNDEKAPLPQAEATPNSEEKVEEWKEDKEFWNSEEVKSETADNASKEKDEGSMWKVQSANGAGGEIQKLKICRQRPAEAPDSGESTKRRSGRPNDGGGSSRSTDESVYEDGEKESKKSKQRTRTSSRNSPSLSESSKVVCDLSGGSPTKIKIKNVSNLILSKSSADESENIQEIPVTLDPKDNSESENLQQYPDVLNSDIPLPTDDQIKVNLPRETDSEEKEDISVSLKEIQPPPEKCNNSVNVDAIKTTAEEPNEKTFMPIDLSEIPEPPDEPKSNKKPENEENEDKEVSEQKPKEDEEVSEPKPTIDASEKKSFDSSYKNQSSRSSSRSSSSSSVASKEQTSPRVATKVKLKRRSHVESPEPQEHISGNKEKESSDSEEELKKEDKEEEKLQGTNKENETTRYSETVEGGEGTSEEVKIMRKRRWGASKSIRPMKKPLVSISTNSLKDLVPGAKPVSTEELQLSVEEEEGQLDDDDEEEDEITILTLPEEKVEETPKEKEREKEEKKKEEKRSKEKVKSEDDKKKKSEKKEKVKPEQPSVNEKVGSERKIVLLSDDARKLARSPSPPRRRPSNILFITHLVRPFTVQQLKNLLLRTGTIAENGFWIDAIKSKCYVEYTTEDAAVETRHALHGVRWPVSNPKTLIVEFSTHDDMAVAQALAEETEPIPRKAEPLVLDRSVEGWLNEQARLKGERPARRVMATVREWDVGKPEHPDEIIEQDLRLKDRQRDQERRVRKDRTHRSPSPDPSEPPMRKPRRKEDDAPAKLLDDLFRKTKTSPCIYWLPLTQDQIVVKEEMRRQHMAEHERRVAELKKADQARRNRERRNRK